jgi:hypothetical protein
MRHFVLFQSEQRLLARHRCTNALGPQRLSLFRTRYPEAQATGSGPMPTSASIAVVLDPTKSNRQAYRPVAGSSTVKVPAVL